MDHCKLHTHYIADCHRCREIRRELNKPLVDAMTSDSGITTAMDILEPIKFEASDIQVDNSPSTPDPSPGFDSSSSGGDFGGGGAGGDF